jgi:hypothetical protein
VSGSAYYSWLTFLSKHWKVSIMRRWVGNIADVEKDAIVVLACPFGAIFGNYCCCVNRVAFQEDRSM